MSEPTSDLHDPEEALARAFGGWQRALERTDLLAAPVSDALRALAVSSPANAALVQGAKVIEVDPALSDTDALNAEFSLDPEATGNCVLVAGKRKGDERVAACVVRATDFADVNHVVKRLIDVHKASFLPMERAVGMSGMEYGGITPIGVPGSWRLLVDARVAERDTVLIGSGVRRSKLLVAGGLLTALPAAEIIEGLGVTPG